MDRYVYIEAPKVKGLEQYYCTTFVKRWEFRKYEFQDIKEKTWRFRINIKQCTYDDDWNTVV